MLLCTIFWFFDALGTSLGADHVNQRLPYFCYKILQQKVYGFLSFFCLTYNISLLYPGAPFRHKSVPREQVLGRFRPSCALFFQGLVPPPFPEAALWLINWCLAAIFKKYQGFFKIFVFYKHVSPWCEICEVN